MVTESWGQPKAPASKIEEVSEFNINNPDILEKLAKIAGCEVENFNLGTLNTLREMFKNGDDMPVWDAGGATFMIVDKDTIKDRPGKKLGDVVLTGGGSGSFNPHMEKRAKEMGM
ncbi:MAG: hypothetical protein WC241_01455 [Candidatus Paceibacterota bacterium]|jgi:hypothetical protein